MHTVFSHEMVARRCERFGVLFVAMMYTLDTFGVIHNEYNSKITGRTISESRLPKQDCRQVSF